MEDGGRVNRRTVLAALGTAALAPTLDAVDGNDSRGDGSAADPVSRREREGDAGDADATLRVRAYPRLQHAADRWSGWTLANVDAYGAVADALAGVAAHATSRRGGATTFDWALEAGTGVSLPEGTDAETLLDRFQEIVRDRGAGDGETCHLLLWAEPLNQRVGYGMARSNVADGDEGAVALVNVGATERWEGRAVTRNMAIHETLHAFLDDEAVSAVVGGTCDHNLGSVRRVDDGVAAVTPLATTYAGWDGPGGETIWPGGGCGDPERFYRRDEFDDVEEWRHTAEPGEGTLDAVSRYVARELAE